MKERLRCPLADLMDGSMIRDEEIPEICRQQCAELWDEAIRKQVVDGPYDVYPSDEHAVECSVANTANTEYSTSGLHKLTGTKRDYVIVDQCGSCGWEIGEQGYIFDCPNNHISVQQ